MKSETSFADNTSDFDQFAELERQKLDALAEFAAGAGHEINNPLAIIGGRTQLLLREIEHPEQRRHLAIILNQVKRAYEMIADIRYFARPPKPEWQTIDISEWLETFYENQAAIMHESQIEWLFMSPLRDLDNTFDTNKLKRQESDEKKSFMILTDPIQLQVALAALCKNARESFSFTDSCENDAAEKKSEFRGKILLGLRYIPANHAILSNTSDETSSQCPLTPSPMVSHSPVLTQTVLPNDMIEVFVEDDGLGIDESIRSLIFSPYFSGREAGRGLGFGLPKTWQIMQQLGGAVFYETPETGKGTRFVLSLPCINNNQHK
ncbi:MAG: histidine kinase dimerization/phospho-acceptor domain-containing protein [Thermoguttaceae bacterium]